MLKNEHFDFGGNGDNLKKKMIANIRYTRLFFLLGVWCGYIAVLSILTALMVFLLSGLSFGFVIYIGDIFRVYGVVATIFIAIKLFPLR